MQFDLLSAGLVALFTLLCAVWDFRTKKIPNWLTVSAAVIGLGYHTFAPHGIGPGWALAGFAVGFSLLIVPWLLGGGGMGDVKMLAALGTWLGPVMVLVAFGGGTILAAVGAIGVIAFSTVGEGITITQRRYLAARADSGIASRSPAKTKARRVLPFAVPVALATWLVLAWMLLVSGQ
jgi:prepilin peptidase CpaA